MIENIQYKFADNTELVAIAKTFLETYIYNPDLNDHAIEEELVQHGSNGMMKEGADTGMIFNI
jgi:hypothetical protein